VDESEFEVLVFGPEGMSIAAMDEAMLAVQNEAMQTKGVALTLTSTGGGFLARVNQGNMYVRTVPHTERTFTFERLWASVRRGDRVIAKTTQGEVMCKLLSRRTLTRIELASFNPAYPERGFDVQDIAWIARIVWAAQ